MTQKRYAIRRAELIDQIDLSNVMGEQTRRALADLQRLKESHQDKLVRCGMSLAYVESWYMGMDDWYVGMHMHGG